MECFVVGAHVKIEIIKILYSKGHMILHKKGRQFCCKKITFSILELDPDFFC